jgi:DHA3 family tetracycline resistance protein-like MFS transporter
VSRLPATRVYYGLELLLSMPAWVVLSLYLVRDLNLSPLQLVLVGTAMEATVFVFEVPTGVVADTYSRRLSLVVGYIGMGLAIIGVGLVSSAAAVIALWAGWGFAYTFTSGAYEAWIADEVGAENVAPIFLRGARISFVGALLGLAAFAAIGVVSLRAAVIAQGVLQLACGLACIALMPETGFRRRPRQERASAVRELRTTAGNGMRFVRAPRVVGLLVVTELFAGFGAEAFDRLREAHVIRDVGFPGSADPVIWFAVIGAVALVFGFVAVGRVIRRVERVGPRSVARMLVGFTALFVVAQLLFAVAGGFGLAIAALVVTLIARSLVGPLYNAWLNQQITDSSVRATVLSISGQANAIGQATGGPLLGAVGNVFGIPAALAAGALTLLPALGLYGRALRHGGVEPELGRLPEPASPAAV